jgi:hypothetical protein
MAVLPTGIGAAAGGGGYQIERSLRFNSADSAYLNRTPASSPTSNQKFTLSCWFKRTALGGVYPSIYCANDAQVGGGYPVIAFSNSTDALYLQLDVGGTTKQWTTTQVFRDLSSWYHIVWAVDTTQATATDRMKLYINGSLVTAYSTQETVTQNGTFSINGTTEQRIGSFVDYGRYLNGYLTEFYMVDGQQLAASSFGETDSATGVWKPKAYSGTYGTNGFYLKFADNSGTTSTTLGKDSSGNGNNWTPNNFSVTAGAGNDSMVDSPTAYGTDTGVGGEVRGNYCTWNPLNAKTTTLTNGNLDGSTTSGMVVGTLAVSSGKWYWECTPTDTTVQQLFGIMSAANTSLPNYPGGSADSYGYYATNGNKYNNSSSSAYGSSYGNGDVIGVALDLDAGTLTFYKNGTTQGTAYSGLSGTFAPASGDGATNAWTANFGQRPFAYTAPSGFKALCTTNLPTPTIGATSTTQANDYFNPVLYTGNGTSSNAITGVGFQPDFVWIKPRSLADHHRLTDAVRGVRKTLKTNLTDAESSNTANDLLYTFDSDGFTIGGSDSGWNGSGSTYVSWNWKANGAGSTNTAGSITSTVSANTTSGFSIVTYTGTGANATVGHGLGVAPSFIITKHRNAADGWYCYHASLGNNAYIQLSSTAARVTPASTYWQTTTPSSTVFSIGTSNSVNQNTINFVAYCFAPVAGYSAFGSYVGNGSTDGPFVYTGFRPRYVLIKASSEAGSWILGDTARSPYNIQGARLFPNATNAEDNNFLFDYLSNGFKVRNSASGNNTNGQTYTYAAFAETPAKFSLAF